ncbi:hypothetical protein IJ847_01180 [Candidatus Saccharibacteria bacterium]|nr:hypothetical protein [Candidatus Saccharibacteria bacterium]
MSERMPSSASSESVDSGAELSEERELGIGKRMLKAFAAVRDRFREPTLEESMERARKKHEEELEDLIETQESRRHEEMAQLQTAGESEAAKSDLYAAIELRSMRIAEAQVELISPHLPRDLRMVAEGMFAPHRRELIDGAFRGEPDKTLPTLLKIAKGGAGLEDLRKALGAEPSRLDEPATPERVSELRLFLRAEPFAKVLTGDMSDTTMLDLMRQGRHSPILRQMNYAQLYKDRLQERLNSEELTELEKQAIEGEIEMADEDHRILSERHNSELERMRQSEPTISPRAETPRVRAKATEAQTRAPELQVPEPRAEAPEPAADGDISEQVYTDLNDPRSKRRIARAVNELIDENVPDEMYITVQEGLISYYEEMIAQLSAAIQEKGRENSGQEIRDLESRRKALARAQTSLVATSLPRELRRDFRDSLDFDMYPEKGERLVVLPVLVAAARGEFDADKVSDYVEELAKTMPREKVSEIMQSYHEHLQVLLDKKQNN